jgi:hypothetical protein
VVTCDNCGREDGHFLGCAATKPSKIDVINLAPADHCAKEGCPNPRAASKGPRPAKYCDEHKTGAKKS